MLNQLARDIAKYREEKGFQTDWANMSEKLMLVVDEIAEAHEDLRAGKIERYYEERDGKQKPCGFGVELADAIIRILDITGSVGIDIEKEVADKMSYNLKRPYKHGKNF